MDLSDARFGSRFWKQEVDKPMPSLQRQTAQRIPAVDRGQGAPVFEHQQLNPIVDKLGAHGHADHGGVEDGEVAVLEQHPVEERAGVCGDGGERQVGDPGPELGELVRSALRRVDVELPEPVSYTHLRAHET